MSNYDIHLTSALWASSRLSSRGGYPTPHASRHHICSSFAHQYSRKFIDCFFASFITLPITFNHLGLVIYFNFLLKLRYSSPAKTFFFLFFHIFIMRIQYTWIYAMHQQSNIGWNTNFEDKSNC